MGRSVDEDPLAAVLAPPLNETAEERETRLRLEAEARQVSDRIDEQLKAEKAALKKNKPVKVLLLGQSESGKSTTLKNFQLAYARDVWESERTAWRTVVQLNLVRGINTIIDLLTDELSGQNTPPNSPELDGSDDEAPPPRSPSGLSFTARHRLLKMRLVPLRTVQRDLEMRIGIQAGEDIQNFLPNVESPPTSPRRKAQEFFVRSSATWKRGHDRNTSDLTTGKRANDAMVRETTEIIAGCADDMQAIWEDETVRALLDRRAIRMELTPGFFLNDIPRIATRDYEPSDNDVIRARLRTLGVQEHRIKFETGPASGSEWCIYDVGGSRTQRYAWYPYFDDCDAIIFLAPVSCFDERLAEDRRINRLEDTFMLWKAVVSSKLLAKTSIVLFLNKCDLLQKKLLSGLRVRDHVHSFGERSNDLETVTTYFAQHFRDMMKKHSPEPRTFRVHMTSVVDTKGTALTLSVVQDGVLREYLKKADLL